MLVIQKGFMTPNKSNFNVWNCDKSVYETATLWREAKWAGCYLKITPSPKLAVGQLSNT